MDKKSTIKIQEGKVGMIGYGMLSSLESLEEILGRKYQDPIYWIHLRGLQRAWNFVAPNNDPNFPAEYIKYESFRLKDNSTITYEKSIFLNIMENKDVRLNCTLYFVTNEELALFDEFELGYTRIDVTDRIEEYHVENGNVYAYKALPTYEYDAINDKDKSIIEKDYLDIVMASYEKMGSEHKLQFELSTVPHDPNLVVTVIHKKVGE
ncbi:MAG: gamma-glutamylcyclotransferase family protein [Arenibacter troitsensis]|nr:gamma-glutamylcyclotransferase family protein [Arenibacter troitsensis]